VSTLRGLGEPDGTNTILATVQRRQGMTRHLRACARRAVGLACFALIAVASSRASDQGPAADGLGVFKAWLDREYKGYGCDEGPAQFRNAAVDAAYGGQSFYYVLTYTRGIRPPFPNSLSLVARVTADGVVERLDSSSPATFQPGLIKVTSTESAKKAAAAVLILTMRGEQRWKIATDAIAVKKSRKGWVCTYQHGHEYYVSEVRFDKKGTLTAIGCNPPPVP
jgi:hypothetical protein